MLATGNQINSYDSYSFETTEGFRGLKAFNQVGIAVIDPSRPSREVPFVIPSRQRGREPRPFVIPSRAYVYRVAVRIPKDIKWQNPEAVGLDANGIVQSTGLVLIGENPSGPSNYLISLPIDPDRNADPKVLDATMVWTKVPGSDYGQFFGQYHQAVSGGLDLPQTIKKNFEGFVQRCPIIAFDRVGTPLPGNLVKADWFPSLTVQPSLIAPTTYTGKK
jgi:hypothetical protein